MANNMTGELYSPAQMEAMKDALQREGGDKVEALKKMENVQEISDKQYEDMKAMSSKSERLIYLGNQSCPCGSNKKRRMCCGN